MITGVYTPDRYDIQDGVVSYPIAFEFTDPQAIRVSYETVAGSEIAVTDFTVEGKTVKLAAPITDGVRIAIWQDNDFLQKTNLKNTGKLDLEVLEADLDKAATERQQLREALLRTVKVSVSSDGDPAELISNLFSAESNAIAKSNVATEQANLATQQQEEATRQAGIAKTYADSAAEMEQAVVIAGNGQVERVEKFTDQEILRVQEGADEQIAATNANVGACAEFSAASAASEAKAEYWALEAEDSANPTTGGGVPFITTNRSLIETQTMLVKIHPLY